MGFTVKKGSEKGSQKGFSEGNFQWCLERPLVEYAPLGVRPNIDVSRSRGHHNSHDGRHPTYDGCLCMPPSAGKSVLRPKLAHLRPLFFDPQIPLKQFVWVHALRSFPGYEAHQLFWGASIPGFWADGGKKFMLKKLLCVFFCPSEVLKVPSEFA